MKDTAQLSLKDTNGYWKEQAGCKDGTVGRPMPQIAAKIVDVDTGEELEANQEGLLYIKGSNVMMGYYGRKDLTDEVIIDNWYCTGDIAMCDEDGFIKITDRLSRFSKIAGEMVPHIKTEEMIQDFMNSSDKARYYVEQKKQNLKEIFAARIYKIRLIFKPISEYPYNYIEIDEIELLEVNDDHYKNL